MRPHLAELRMQNKTKRSMYTLRGEKHSECEENPMATLYPSYKHVSKPTFTDIMVQNKTETIFSSYGFRKLTRVHLLNHDT